MVSIQDELKGVYAASATVLQSWIRAGTNIYSEEWDALIILDACRADALREVADEYDFLTGIDTRWSRGSTSKEWVENTFTEEHRSEIESTVYVTANPFSAQLMKESVHPGDIAMANDSSLSENPIFSKLVRDDVVHASDFCKLVKLWDVVTGDDDPQLQPEPVTDCAIQTGRETDCEQLIVHYMQPHQPYLHPETPREWHKEPFAHLKQGEKFEEVWEAYIDNLRYVLDDVQRLLENLDAEKTTITADHGELFGEWGLHSHIIGVPHPALRKVPWVKTTAQDTRSSEPETDLLDKSTSEDHLEEQLEALGYR